MAQFFKIVLWNANNVLNRKNELKVFVILNKIDILLVSIYQITTSIIRIIQMQIGTLEQGQESSYDGGGNFA